MAGVVLETLSFKKLMVFAVAIALFQVASFLLGGLIAPAPSSSESLLGVKCVDRISPLRGQYSDRWFFQRPRESPYSCNETVDKISSITKKTDASQVVFMFQFPLPKSGYDLDMTRWFQRITGLLHLDTEFHKEMQVGEGTEIYFDVRLGYRSRHDPPHVWKELARSRETRPLKCTIDKQKEGYNYDCEVMPLFSLGSCHHDYYLVNIRLPVDEDHKLNLKIGAVQDIWIVEFHQNGGFTKVWFALKTFVFPINVLAAAFFWRRINKLVRKPNLLEKTIFVLAVVTSFLNCPVEWLSLKLDFSFWLVLSDVRQGLFYSTLLCFWVVFTGEHMMDEAAYTRDKITSYWKHLLVIGFGSAFLFIFDISERGVQLSNPFYSVWSNPVPARMAYVLVILAGICGGLYFLFLCYMIIQVFRGMWSKRRLLPSLPEARRRYYSGIIYRFCALLVYTMLCAGLTVCFFIASQLYEDSWKWGDRALEYSSAFITGVYGMWNAYVFSLLCLYAPSHKQLRDDITTSTADPLLDGTSRLTATDGEAFELRSPGDHNPQDDVRVAATAASGDGLSFLMKAAHD